MLTVHAGRFEDGCTTATEGDSAGDIRLCMCVFLRMHVLAETVGHCPEPCTHADCDLIRLIYNIRRAINRAASN